MGGFVGHHRPDFADIAIEEGVADYSVLSRDRAGEYRRVPAGCKGRHVVVIRVSEERALTHQALESAVAEQIAKAFEIIVTELVDYNDKDELRLVCRRALRATTIVLLLRCARQRKKTDDNE